MNSLPSVALYQLFINKAFNEFKFTNKPTQEMTIYEGSVYMLVQNNSTEHSDPLLLALKDKTLQFSLPLDK